ncbi:inactive polyglycylase TTLL10 isoform X5 [Mustela erminea]|uniref:inactive polyglycylase TTLL10 isoform X5 n=1 Tax=Mustela erminea TaxID=36723 RepID=UPI001386D47F|nr:inactive polyglycylase TTLL10 isoform X5 [Mustela erminea]
MAAGPLLPRDGCQATTVVSLAEGSHHLAGQVHLGLPLTSLGYQSLPVFLPKQRCPRPGAPAPTARSHPHFLHRRGPPSRTHMSGKRSKRSRTARLRGSHTRVPGWAHERPMGSNQEEQLLRVLSRLEQGADLSDDTDGVRPQAALLEKHLLDGEKQPHSSGQGPYFYIGGNNGASIISSYCKGKGWQRIQDSRREDYKLKWCEVKCRDNYYSFREGEQLLYQIPNNKLLTTKIGLLSALREYARAVKTAHKTPLCAQAKVLKMEEFFPETYRLDIRDEREAFFTVFDGNHIWICKPSACNQGKGIFLLRNQEEVAALQVKTQSIEDDPIYRKMPFRAPQARVVQRKASQSPVPSAASPSLQAWSRADHPSLAPSASGRDPDPQPHSGRWRSSSLASQRSLWGSVGLCHSCSLRPPSALGVLRPTVPSSRDASSQPSALAGPVSALPPPGSPPCPQGPNLLPRSGSLVKTAPVGGGAAWGGGAPQTPAWAEGWGQAQKCPCRRESPQTPGTSGAEELVWAQEGTRGHRLGWPCPQPPCVPRYIQNPLLLDGKKFDVRAYLLIACAMPYMVFFGHGYARLTLSLYDPHSSDLSGHLTNQFMQKKSPLYVLLKEDTVWSMDRLNRHINDKFRKTKGLPRDWVFTTFTKRMQQIMAHCFQAVKSKLHCKLGYFDLIGCDFLIDENFKVWLLEMNSNPALHTNCEVLKEVIPGVVMETLDLAIETFQKSLRHQKMLPLLSQRRFALLHNGEADLWPRLGGPRSALRPPPPRPAGEADCSKPPPPRAVDRPGARRPALPRSPGGAHRRPPSAQRRPRPPGPGPDGAQSGEPGAERPRAGAGDPAREPSPGLAAGRKNAGLRGS